MSRSTIILGIAALTLVGTSAASGQQPSVIPKELRAASPPRQNLAGPRFGLTVFTGEVAAQRRRADLSPIMSQFGWQWETQLVSTTDGARALLEWVALLGGLEQGETNISLSFLAGLRMPNGLEFGVGPNVGVNLDQEMTSRSMVVAAGATVPVGSFYVPINTAIAFAPGGPRLTFLTGWIVGT